MRYFPKISAIAICITTLLLTGTTNSAFSFLLPSPEGPIGDKHRPVVEAIDAQKEIEEGALWRIYLRASDPDGDLDKIHVTFSQAGTGPYSPDLLVQKTKVQTLNGFILVWAKLVGGGVTGDIPARVEIRVEDRAGNMSRPKSLEFTVVQFGREDQFVPASGFDTSTKIGQADFPLETETDIGKAG